jgi:hypothetical protein
MSMILRYPSQCFTGIGMPLYLSSVMSNFRSFSVVFALTIALISGGMPDDALAADNPLDDLKVVEPEAGSVITLPVLKKEVSGEIFAVTGSGAIWTIAPEGPPRFHKGKRVSASQSLHLGYDDDLEPIGQPAARNQITFFDKGEWHVVPWTDPLNRGDRNGPTGRFAAGHDNTVFVIGDEKTILVQGMKVIDDGQILDLIFRHQTLVRRSFGSGTPHPICRDNWNRHTMIHVDSEGRIWCLHNFDLHVLINDEWLNCRDSFVKAGHRTGRMSFLLPGPEGRFLFVGDGYPRHDGGTSFLANVNEGEVTLTSTYHAIESHNRYPAVREQDRAIWIANPEGRAVPQADMYFGQSAIRIDQNGNETHRLKLSGYPVLSDPIGLMWLGRIRGGPPNQFNIVQNGKVVQTIQIPGIILEGKPSPEYQQLFCDGPGSVYVHTSHGLLHMVVDMDRSRHYRPGKWYSCGEAGDLSNGYSNQGYCLSLKAGYNVKLKFLHLTRLPMAVETERN